MATADQIETQIDAIVTALETLLGYAPINSNTGLPVTATSTRQHAVKMFTEGYRPLGQAERAFDVGTAIGGMRTSLGKTLPDSGVILAEDAHCLFAIVKVRK